jgi:arsenite-transporting ATPase
LKMARIYDEWINKITDLREQMREYDKVASVMKRETVMEEDKILSELLFIKERINASSQILTDKERTAFFFVVVPEEMIIIDTKNASQLFADYVPIAGYVVNRVVPEELLKQSIPDYLRNRIAMQQKYMSEIRDIFGDGVKAYVPELERDVTGLAMIEKLAHIMYGDF